ncbi:Gfo/Idh/MocA family protein [Tautonia rosea]|uniref:Gfo/Idh/MocA family protein n=1 Tax=Tautonia rosea TaxID=2728037 RepID=UPI0014761FED|nr:Gfo/Idh/MocA family oxidoreductase [Tautonia rosea]
MSIRSSLSRRRFLQRAAAVSAAPWIVPHSVFGRNGSAPSERIRLGFIGMGKQSQYHLRWFLDQDDVQVLAVCDVDTTRRDDARAKVDAKYENSDCAAYNDDRELIARDDIDAVVICTPDHWHAITILEACKAGKDIYCEKPLTLTIHEAKACIDAVKAHDIVFQTGSQQRSSPEFRQACEVVRNGMIGDIKRVLVDVGGPSHWCDLGEEPLEPGLDWDRWLGPAPERPYNEVLSPRGVHDHYPNWRSFREYSGGGMTDWGAHHFDIAQWGLGMDHSGPSEVILPDDPSADRGVTFLYPGGIEVIHGPGGGVTFIGTEGEVFVNRGQWRTTPESLKDADIPADGVHLYDSPGHQRDWLNCIRERRQPICDVEVGARSVTVCHLGNLAYWHRRPLRWDPSSWSFLDDTDPALLDIDRRAPYLLPTL